MQIQGTTPLTTSLLYLTPPTSTISRLLFQTYTELRLALYAEIDTKREQLDTLMDSASEFKIDWKKFLQGYTNQQRDFLQSLMTSHLSYNASKISMDELRKRDTISHYVCRLACCLDPALRARFCDYQSKIFRVRLAGLPPAELLNIIKVLEGKLDCEEEIRQVSEEEMREKAELIYAGLRWKKEFDEWRQHVVIWKMPVRICGFLLDRRDCYVEGGFLYADATLLIKIAAKMYYRYLVDGLKGMQSLANSILQDDTDNQFKSFVKSAPSLINRVTSTPDDIKQRLNLSNLDFFAKKSFPPCMLNLYNHAIKQKHLKHWGRMQLMLFLKGAGMSMQDSGRFWKTNYKNAKETDEKQVQYNVRHMYGAEGQRKDYAPYGCHSIINFKVGSGEHHGCPFRYFGNDELRGFLTRNYGLSAEDAMQVVQKNDGKHHEVACKFMFRKIHNDPREKFQEIAISKVGSHPNKYYHASRKYYEELAKQPKPTNQNSQKKPATTIPPPTQMETEK